MAARVLGLLFTQGISLKTWDEKGLLDREKLIYESHLNQGSLSKVYWFTHGVDDGKLARRLKDRGDLHPDIEVIGLPLLFYYLPLGSLIYSILLPLIRKKLMRKLDILKSNQMKGAWTGVLAKLFLGIFFHLRTGYTISIFVKKEGRSLLKQKLWRMIEALCYRACDLATVTSREDLKYIRDLYEISEQKSRLVPNYIDTDLFDASKVGDDGKSKVGDDDMSEVEDDSFVFVGRLNQQKNLQNLIIAMKELGQEFHIYGAGELELELKELAGESYHSDSSAGDAADSGLSAGDSSSGDAADNKSSVNKIHFHGLISNQDLPQVLGRHRYFLLCSHFEGMPKSLLEAMACSRICIGTPVEGIRELIEDEETGYMAKSVELHDLKEVIQRALDGIKDHSRIREQTRNFILENYSLDSVVRKEISLWKESS